MSDELEQTKLTAQEEVKVKWNMAVQHDALCVFE